MALEENTKAEEYAFMNSVDDGFRLSKSEKKAEKNEIMIKTIIYYIRQFFNIVCVSSGLSCVIKVFTHTLTNEMKFVIGSIGVLSIVYGANKIIDLYGKQNKE